MAAITASSVMDLKNRTNAGMMECKKALADADGDVDKAVALTSGQWHRRGAPPQSSEMKEGLVAVKISPDAKLGEY